ncbi:polycystic kidney disease and receptor for egg jelly-related protein-like [Lagopus muta]|uniref:polycystic kidney disease and receptor for egg jelly-related protein-like n=1 Tax=Lagopus muta TaxID=64668 RepID=UPI00209F1782|nr:polycystic kidney disease and receptor for egg jelly-related protein-like [Lagopus muta]
MQPPPLAVSCLGAPGRGSAGRSGEGWLSCLGNGTLRLRYRPAPGATAEAESTERQPASPPHCRWYLNWGWVKNTSLWSGQFTLQSGLSLGSALWPVASSLITVQCSSASCAAPECLYRNLSVEMSARWAAQKSSHAYRDGTRSATCLFHCSAFPGDPEKHQGFVAKVSSTRNGLTPALPSVRDDTSKATELAVLHQEAACKLNSVTIQKPPLHTSVIRQKKGTTFYLYARVLVDCNLHVSIKPQWIFYAVKDMKTNPDWDQPLNTSAMHGVNTVQLTVPSWTLDYGMYQVYFTASVYVLGTKRSFSKTDRVFVEIERSDLVASIAGGNFRTVGFFDNWTLDGSVSYDPDSPERLKGLTFTWYCTKKLLDYESMRISAGNKCHPAQRDLRWLTSSGAVQVLAPESLPGNTVYHFRLVIQKDRRQSYADQSVNVQSGFSPLLDVACLENCGSAVIPTERFTLSGRCLNCQTSSQIVYHWSLWMENSTEISFDWSSRTSTGRSGAYLSIHALTFTSTADQSYILLLQVTTWGGRSSLYRYAFKVNSPPKAGKCSVSPHRGTAFLTKFVVQCSGFSDSNLPLTYKVIVASDKSKTAKINSVEDNTFGTIVYFGYQPRMPPSPLPVGVPSRRYALTLYVQVCDSLGAFTQLSLHVRAQNPVRSRPLAVVFHELFASVSGLSAPMTAYLQTGDYFNAGYLAYLAASVLNYIEAAPTLPIPKAQLRESLLKAALNISVESTMEINQVVASLFQVTEQPEEVNARSQEIAITKLTEVTGVLKTQRNESRWSEQTEIQTSGILKCLSNILSAALLRRRKVNVSAVTQVFSIMENLTEIVFQGKVPGEEDTVMETSNWKITLMKDENWDVANAFSTTEACRNCFYPTLKTGNSSRLSYDAIISTALFEFDENPFPWLNYTSEIATAILGFKMAETKANGDLLGILPEEANILIARKDTKSSTFQLAMGPDKTQTYTTGGFSLEVNRDTKIIYIQILTKLEVAFQVLVFAGTNVTQNFPIASFDAFHNMTTVASKTKAVDEECNIKAPYIICLTESVLNIAAQGSGAQSQNISIVLLTPYITRYPNMRLVSIHTFSDHCLFLGGVQNQWREDTCRLGSLTNWQRVHCVCSMKQSHRSRSVLTASNISTLDIKFLAAKVIVTPNRVDLKGNLIADIPKNPVTLLTVLFIFAAYFLLSLWAVRKDRAEMVSKDKIIVLPDNDPFDKVSFLVTLYTGSRWGAGTSADVFLQLIGQNGTSDVHCLRLPQFPAFRRGSTDCFLLTTKEDLGDIRAFRVWHNNRGPSPGWFLSRAKVEHVSARKTWFFMCRKWLALDKGDGLLERTFSVTNPKAPLSRKDYFLIDLASGLKEGHLWLSVFAQVLTGTYSRLQRLSSCLTILLLNLFVNIMFFNADRDEESPRHLRYLRSIAIGIECALITIPVEMIIMALFKYSQKNPERSLTLLPGNLKTWRVHSQKRKRSETSAQSGSIRSPENVPAHSDSQGPTHNLKRRTEGKTRSQGAPQDSSNCPVSEGGASTAGDKEQTGKNSRPKVKARRRRLPSNSNFSNNCAKEAGNLQEESKLLSVSSVPFCKRPPIVCCWWCVYLSWVLVITVSGVSSFFIVLYGLSYGYQTSLEWLLASATSFIQNVFFVSIIKISCYSALNTVRPKYCENIPWFTQDLSSEIKAEKEAMNEEEMREKHFKLAQIRDTEQYKPLKDGEIAKMLETAKIKAKAFIFIKDVIGHLVVLAVVLCLAYSTENTISFHYNQFIRNQFSPRLPAVVKLADIYTWVNDTFLPLIHNDVQPTFLTDSSSKIIGLPRMRQVRAKGTEKTCFHPHSFVNKFVISKSHCLHKYGRDLEEKGDYAGTWTKVANRSFSKETSSYPGFTYQPNRAPWTYFSYGDLHTYGPGGYTFYFFPEEGRHNSTTRLHLLQESNWLDEKTWAVIIELTTFNSDGDLFCSISVIFELSDFGIIKPTLSVHSFAVPIFHQQTKGRQLFFLAAVAFLLMYIADGLYSMVQGKKSISRTISFILKWAFFLIVPFQVLKFKMGADIVHFFLLYPNDFIPFHAVSHLDQNLRNTLGFLAFLAVLKTLKYSQLFYEVRLAQRSILAALPGISSMASVVVVYFSIFMAFGYLVFGQHEWNYNNMIHSAQTVFSYCVSAFRDTAFSSSRLLGGFFLTSFLLVMTCVLINLFQAVIMSAYGDRKQLVYEEPPDEARAVAFLLQRMKKMLCFPICRTAKRSDPNLCHGVPNGQAEKRVQ